MVRMETNIKNIHLRIADKDTKKIRLHILANGFFMLVGDIYPRYFIKIFALPLSRSFAILFSRI